MYLAKLILNPRARQVQRDLGNPYELHRTLLSAFPETLPAGERVLFRVDVDARSGIPAVLLQSHGEPDWSWLNEPGRQGYLLPRELWPAYTQRNPDCKPFELAFAPGQTLAFRLRANPTVKHHRLDDDGKDCATRDPLYREDEQRAWLERKGEAGGFSILQLNISDEGNANAWKPLEDGDGRQGDKRRKLTHFAVRFDGLLRVSDPDALWGAVQRGIGPAKSFGFGLLSLAPAH